MKKYTLVLVFVIIGNQVSFQQDTIDDLNHYLTNSQNDTMRLAYYYLLGMAYNARGNRDSATNYAQKIIALSKEKNIDILNIKGGESILFHSKNVGDTAFNTQKKMFNEEYIKQLNLLQFNEILHQQELKKAQNKINPYTILFSIGVCLILFFVLWRHFSTHKRLPTFKSQILISEQKWLSALSAEELEWLEKLNAYIKEHIADCNLTAESIAEGVCVSRAQLFRRVKKLTGLTPHDYLNELRFNHARKCLENGTYSSVKSVSYAVGMKHLTHFSHQFKLRFGKCPSEYFYSPPSV